jgi:RNA polymerase sigma-70 factor (ECF subfamily)
MTERDALLVESYEGRQRFLALVAAIRPELHRYCARMTGSIADGEDVVQETLARAYYTFAELEKLPSLRPWLFRIAHHCALDHFVRRYERRMSEPLDAVLDTTADTEPDPEDALAREEAVRSALSRFVGLVPLQRSCVILKDVLGHSLGEIAALLELSVPAIKAALHRGRTRLRELGKTAAEPTPLPRSASPLIVRYANLFNARDWDGVRAMLADDVRLDLLSRSRRAGRHDVAGYFANYDRLHDWHLVPAWLDGAEIIAVFREARAAHPGYFMQLDLIEGRIATIRDFRYIPYVADEAAIELSIATNR